MKLKLQRAEEILLYQKITAGEETTKMRKFEKFYGDRVGASISSLRFGLRGRRRVHDEETIKDVALEMEQKQDDHIVVYQWKSSISMEK